MYCPKCGKENGDDSEFCVYCGCQLSSNQQQVTDYAMSGDNVQTEQQPTKNKTETMSEKLKREMLIKLIVAIVLLVVFLAVSGVAFERSSNPQLVPAEQFSSLTSSEYDYVTADIACVIPFYEYYTESSGGKKTDYYTCIAIDTNYDTYTIKVPYLYYSRNLSRLEYSESFSYDGYERIYGTVHTLDSDAKNDLLKETNVNSDWLNGALDSYCIEVLSSPKTEPNTLTPVAFLAFVLFLVGLIIFIKSLTKTSALKKAQRDYGDVADIIESTRANALYSDNAIAVSKDYIVSNNKKITIVSTQEALCLYQYVHKTNFVVDNVALVVVNKYGEKINFNYKTTQSKLVPQVIAKIYPLFPNAVFGFNSETMTYVKENRILRK